jgi:FeS assembly SUF system protein
MFGRFRRNAPAFEDPPAADAPAAATESAAQEDPAPAAADDRPLEELIVDALRTIYDPEIPVNIYELGLIYDVAVPAEAGEGAGEQGVEVGIKMTLTSPHCPVAESLPGEVKRRVEGVAGVSRAEVEIVWDPAWNPDMMSEAAKLELGFF